MDARQRLLAVADDVVAGAQAVSTTSGAMLAGQERAVDGLEGFARSFLLAAMRIRSEQGQPEAWCAFYREALTAGVTPGHPDAWPAQTDHGQATVEATVIAVGLHLTRPWIWDQLPERTRDAIVDWLSGEHWSADNNHVLFGAICQAFVHSVAPGRDVSAAWAALDRIEEWYVGDGWYTDGDGRRFDHYNAWTFHLYPFWMLDMLDPDGAETAARRSLYRSRLRQFCAGYRHLFAADGSFVALGRSLIYRFGVVAPFFMAELEGCSPLPPGATGRLALDCVDYFLTHGAVHQGQLTLGWHGPHPDVLQSYNKPGSPLWGGKAFLGLLLPADHRAWRGDGAPPAPSSTPVVHSGPEWLTWGHPGDRIVRLMNLGSDGHPAVDDPLYRRSLYSSATLPSFRPEVADQTVGPVGGRHLRREAGVARPSSGAERSRWLAQGRDVLIDHAVVVSEGAEIHLARCTQVVGLPIGLGGWLVPNDLEGFLGLVSHDGRTASEHDHHFDDTPLGPCRLAQVVIVPDGNELRVCWVTGLGAAVERARQLVADLSVEWRPGGAVVQLRDGTAVAAFVSGHRLWAGTGGGQHVHRWE